MATQIRINEVHRGNQKIKENYTKLVNVNYWQIWKVSCWIEVSAEFVEK